jgi:hypothetical protein
VFERRDARSDFILFVQHPPVLPEQPIDEPGLSRYEAQRQ